MNKKEKEILNTLRVSSRVSSERQKQATNKYTKVAKRLCKGLNDAAFSVNEFTDAMNQVANLSRTKGLKLRKQFGGQVIRRIEL